MADPETGITVTQVHAYLLGRLYGEKITHQGPLIRAELL